MYDVAHSLSHSSIRKSQTARSAVVQMESQRRVGVHDRTPGLNDWNHGTAANELGSQDARQPPLQCMPWFWGDLVLRPNVPVNSSTVIIFLGRSSFNLYSIDCIDRRLVVLGIGFCKDVFVG